MRAADIAAVVDPLVAASGLEVDRIEIGSAGKRAIVRIFLDGDGPEGRGPSLDQIADATRAISVALDESPVIGDAPYVLEVSSRGVGRPLIEPKHFRRNIGRLVALTLSGGEKVLGRVIETDAEGVHLDVDGAQRDVPLAQIVKAVVQVEMNRSAADEPDEIDGVDDEE